MGVFIYKTKGSFPNSFIMEGVDVILMAKGSAAEVGYKTTPELIETICDLGYEDYSRALLHSHHGMSTGWSNTDHSQLELAASTSPYYLSVVVNNKLEFDAKVAIQQTEEYRGYSHIIDLKGKLIKSPISKTNKSFKKINVETIIEKPSFMIDVDTRHSAIQVYTGGNQLLDTINRPANYYGNNHYIPNKSYAPPAYKTNSYYKKPVQQKLFNNFEDVFNTPFVDTKPVTKEIDIDEYSEFVRQALKEYKSSFYLTSKDIEDLAEAIVNDDLQYGLSVDYYILYLKENTFIDNFTDNLLIKELEELKELKILEDGE